MSFRIVLTGALKKHAFMKVLYWCFFGMFFAIFSFVLTKMPNPPLASSACTYVSLCTVLEVGEQNAFVRALLAAYSRAVFSIIS